MEINVGQRIRAKRLEKEMTQEQLAKLVGYKNRTSINKIEDSTCVAYPKIEEIAKALGCSPEYLLGWETDDGIKRPLFSDLAFQDVQLVTRFRKLPATDQDIIMTLIDMLEKRNK